MFLELEQIRREDTCDELVLFRNVPDPDLWHHCLSALHLGFPEQVSRSLVLLLLLEKGQCLPELDLVET